MGMTIRKGGEYLVEECPAGEIFTPEDFGDEQKQLGETIRQFVSNEVLPNIERLEGQDFRLMVRLLKMCGELGFFLIEVPEEHGGLDLSKATGMLAAEKISPYAGFLAAFMVQSGIGLLPLVYYGTPEQKEKYLGRIAGGEWISAYCLTEPDSGSDALGAKTSAVLSADESHYVLNGTKQFITNGGFADIFTVFAKVDRKRFTAFLVERSLPGVSTGPEEKKLGIKASSTTPVTFEDVKVPAGNVLGEVGKGHKIAFNVLNVGRLKLGAAVTGTAKAAFAEGLKYAGLRKQFGVPIRTFGAIREKIADMAAAIFAAESSVYRLAGMIDDRLATTPRDAPGYLDACQKGIEEYAAECAIAKVFCSEVLARVVDAVVQIHGGYGFIREYPAERFYRDERVNRIFEGTNEINRILVAATLLKRGVGWESGACREARTAGTPPPDATPSVPEGDAAFAGEKALLRNLKSVFGAIANSARTIHGNAIGGEQEILMALADVAINVFAVESAVLRGEKIRRTLFDEGRRTLEGAVRVAAYEGAERASEAARKAVCFLERSDDQARLFDAVRALTRYNVPGLLQAKRELADAAIAAERYVFGV